MKNSLSMKVPKKQGALSVSKHKTSKGSVMVSGSLVNVNKLIRKSPLLLWNKLHSGCDREVLGKPEFSRLLDIIKKKYPKEYSKHLQSRRMKFLKKSLIKDISNDRVNNGLSRFKKVL